jgi:hypothetical protein
LDPNSEKYLYLFSDSINTGRVRSTEGNTHIYTESEAFGQNPPSPSSDPDSTPNLRLELRVKKVVIFVKNVVVNSILFLYYGGRQVKLCVQSSSKDVKKFPPFSSVFPTRIRNTEFLISIEGLSNLSPSAAGTVSTVLESSLKLLPFLAPSC